ncbi:hypothetical protein [Rhodovulum strictum]|uniref:Uncharacterized protein n=1 Tax=Rhodovulum strictum TaxID=58314 RepID=A0A844BR70_9RHOB|nr:hypothetical protein [Rhodovulum strictum]MRH22437.1 hypothetical protein [Rhodovulum strictum]
MGQVPINAWGNPVNPPMGQPKPKRIRCKLDTVADVKAEACKLYRSVRAKEIDASEAGKLAYLLQIIAKLAETADLEARLSELENEQ